jgi:hypothetical protein
MMDPKAADFGDDTPVLPACSSGSGPTTAAGTAGVAGADDTFLGGLVSAIATILVGVAALVGAGHLGGVSSPALPIAQPSALPPVTAPAVGADEQPLSQRPASVAAELASARPLVPTTPTAGTDPIGWPPSPGEPATGPAPAPRVVRLSQPVVGPDSPTYIAFVLDGSGSMLERAENGRTKMEQATTVVGETIEQLPRDVYASVRLFGHRVPESNKRDSCLDSELLVPFQAGAEAGRALSSVPITPKGWTPLAANLQLAAQEFPSGVNRAIVLVSDGKETCGGDPVAAARAIRASDPAPRIFTVGFRVDPKARDQLRAVADVGGGSYEDASDRDALVEALRAISAKSTNAVPPQ